MNPLKKMRTRVARPHLRVSVLPPLVSVETLRQAQERLAAQLDKGLGCPCCGQFAKLYKRKLNAGMAAALIAFYRVSSDWFEVRKMRNSVLANREYPKLRFWGLLEQKAGAPGFWRITWNGRAFAEGKIVIPKHIYLYDGNPVQPAGVEVESVFIKDALGDKFDYAELMRSAL